MRAPLLVCPRSRALDGRGLCAGTHFDIAGASGTPGSPLAGNGWGVQTVLAWVLGNRVA